VFCEEGRSVDRVYVGGRMVVAGGEILTLDREALRRRVGARAAALQEQNGPKRAALAVLEPHVRRFCVGLSRAGETGHDRA
jgi:hypothetical protein